MRATPFLTDLDTRAAVKGSRDPLGIQSIWTRLGRHVVGNLTTVSSTVRDYTTLLLGYWFAHQLSEELGPGSELATFLKWEQLVGYARAKVNDDFAFRGTGRVQANLAESNTVRLSAERSRQILGNQKIYGLWGLFTMPARASGLLDDQDPPRPTAPALSLIEEVYLPVLEAAAGPGTKGILELLREDEARVDLVGRHARIVEAVAKLLRPTFRPKELAIFREHLVASGPLDPTRGVQRQLATLLASKTLDADFGWTPKELVQLAKAARARQWETLAHHLDRIRTCEAVMAPMSALFAHLLGLEGKPASAARDRLREEWGTGVRTIDVEAFADLRGELAQDSAESADRWIAIARSAQEGQYQELIDLLVRHNAAVMDSRGGASWLELRDGKFNVRFRDEQGELPRRKELPLLWRFPYFLDSLRNVVATVGVA